MKKLIPFMVILIIMISEASGFGQIKPGAYSVSPFIGGYTFEGNMGLRTRPVYGLRMGYDFTKHLGAELLFDYVATNHIEGTSEPGTDVYNYRLEGLYHFMPEKRLVPFVSVGIGGQNINYSSTAEDKSRFVADYGVGLKYFLTDSIALRADVRHVLVFGSLYNNLEYALGVAFSFGGKKAASKPFVKDVEAEPALPPPPVAKEPEPAPPPPVKAPEPAPAPPPPPPVREPEPAPAPPPPPPVIEEMKKAPEAASEVEKEIIEKGRATLMVQFDTGKAIVKPVYNKEIQKVADVMNKYKDLNIVVEGHTDNVGGKQYNLNLSQKRAEAIKKVMATKFKINSDRIKAKGFGYSKPIASNSTKEGKQKNRRVEAAVEYIIKK
jgi:OmpA-OmpF porin, OOP family